MIQYDNILLIATKIIKLIEKSLSTTLLNTTIHFDFKLNVLTVSSGRRSFKMYLKNADLVIQFIMSGVQYNVISDEYYIMNDELTKEFIRQMNSAKLAIEKEITKDVTEILETIIQ